MGIEHIDSRSVRVALCHLGRDRAPGAGPLAELTVVRGRLRAAGFAADAAARGFEVGRLLSEVVERELWLRRRQAGLPREGGDDPASIRADFATGHVELEALSAIYHLYVRSDLALGLDAFVRLLGDRHRRTVQRRLEHGVALVVHRLRELERDAELAARRGRCIARLPSPPDDPVGIEALADRLAEALAARGGRPMALGGIGGVGKTTVARAAALRLLEDGRIGDVRWIRAPGASGAARRERADGAAPPGSGRDPDRASTRPEDAARSPRPTFGAVRAPERLVREALGGGYGAGERMRGLPDPFGPTTLVVVDGLDRPGDARRTAARMARLAVVSPVLLVGRAGWSGVPSVDALWVPPLGPEAACRMLERRLRRAGARPATGATALAALAAATAGVPVAIARAAEALRVHDAGVLAAAFLEGSGVAKEALEAVWGTAWDAAPPEARRAVRSVVALRAAGLAAHAENVATHLHASTEAAGAALASALDHGLIEAVPGPRHPLLHPLPLLERYVALVDRAPRAA